MARGVWMLICIPGNWTCHTSMMISNMAQGGLFALAAAGILGDCYDSSNRSRDGSEGDDPASDPASEVDARPDITSAPTPPWPRTRCARSRA